MLTSLISIYRHLNYFVSVTSSFIWTTLVDTHVGLILNFTQKKIHRGLKSRSSLLFRKKKLLNYAYVGISVSCQDTCR